MKYLILVITVLLSAAGFPAYAQDIEKAGEWLKKCTEAYRSLESMSTDIEYRVFAGHDNSILLDRMTGALKKSGMNSYSRYATSEIIENEENIIVINSVTRQIVVRKKWSSVFRPVFADAFDSLVPHIDSAVVNEVADEVKIYLWFARKPGVPYVRTDIFIDTPTLQAKQVNLYFTYPVPMYEETSFHQPGKLEIIYRNTLINPVLPAGIFSTSTYVTDMNGGVYAGAGKLKDYKVFYMAN